MEHAGANSKQLTPFVKTECLSRMRPVNNFGTAVMRLLLSCCPSTISRLVVSIIIYSVNRCSIRRVAHIFAEFGNIVPATTHGYAPAAVISIGLVFGIVASLHHLVPNAVNFRVSHAVAFASLKKLFGGIAPARFSRSRNNERAACYVGFSAIAKALVHRMPVAGFDLFKNRKPVKLLADNIGLFRFSHNFHNSSQLILSQAQNKIGRG